MPNSCRPPAPAGPRAALAIYRIDEPGPTPGAAPRPRPFLVDTTGVDLCSIEFLSEEQWAKLGPDDWPGDFQRVDGLRVRVRPAPQEWARYHREREEFAGGSGDGGRDEGEGEGSGGLAG